MNSPVSLQINLAPVDLPLLPDILPHQLRTFAHLCDEVVLTLETKMSKKSRWTSDKWNENLEKVYSLIDVLSKEFENIRLSEIDYSESKRAEVSRYFLKSKNKLLPWKDFRGGPSYSYYYGLFGTKNPYVLHMDSDILFSGKADKWLNTSLKVLNRDRSILVCAPLGGPPKYEGEMPKIHKRRYNPIGRYKDVNHGFLYKDISTRIFLIEKERLRQQCILIRPNLEQVIKAWIRGIRPYHTPERSWSAVMKRNKQYRLDFLGEEPGFWCYHYPPTSLYPHLLPLLDVAVSKIETSFFNEEQRGWQDFKEDFIEALREFKNKKTLPE